MRVVQSRGDLQGFARSWGDGCLSRGDLRITTGNELGSSAGTPRTYGRRRCSVNADMTGSFDTVY